MFVCYLIALNLHCPGTVSEWVCLARSIDIIGGGHHKTCFSVSEHWPIFLFCFILSPQLSLSASAQLTIDNEEARTWSALAAGMHVLGRHAECLANFLEQFFLLCSVHECNWKRERADRIEAMTLLIDDIISHHFSCFSFCHWSHLSC